MITWGEEPFTMQILKIKCINSASEFLENYFKFPRSRDLFITNMFNIYMCHLVRLIWFEQVCFEKLIVLIRGNSMYLGEFTETSARNWILEVHIAKLIP